MQVGYQVGQVVQARSVPLQQQWQHHLEQFRIARDVGFDIYCWGHHYLISPFQHFQPLPALARLAAESGSMTLATSVLLLPLLNPVDVAEQVATLDHICQGRFILGLGLGYRPEECEALGIRMSERVGRFTEGLALMKRLWTEEEITHHGRYYHVTGARPTARPYQQPYPQIWVAAMTDAAVRRVGRQAHNLFFGPAQSFSTIRRQVALYRQALKDSDRQTPQEMVVMREFFCARSREEAIKQAQQGLLTKYQAYAEHGFQGNDPELTEKITGNLETLMEDTFIVGSPQECLEQIARYRGLGITTVDLRLFYPNMPQKVVLKHIELTGKEVLPQVHRL